MITIHGHSHDYENPCICGVGEGSLYAVTFWYSDSEADKRCNVRQGDTSVCQRDKGHIGYHIYPIYLGNGGDWAWMTWKPKKKGGISKETLQHVYPQVRQRWTIMISMTWLKQLLCWMAWNHNPQSGFRTEVCANDVLRDNIYTCRTCGYTWHNEARGREVFALDGTPSNVWNKEHEENYKAIHGAFWWLSQDEKQ